MDITELRQRRSASAQMNWQVIEQEQRHKQERISQEMDLDHSSTSGKKIYSKKQSDKIPPHPPGYNKHKRDIVKLILVVVAAALLRGDPVVATVLSLVSIYCLKEGTFWSTKNLKWMALCIMSCALSSASWSLERDSVEENEPAVWFGPDSMLWTSAKVIELCWGMTLSVFLVSAYRHGHNSLLEFDFLYDKPAPPSGPRRDPPPKTYLIY